MLTVNRGPDGRFEPEPIRLQFVAQDDFCSRAICWFSAGHLSHVDAILPDGRLYGARNEFPRGVWARPPGYRAFTRRVTATIPATAAQRGRFYDFLRRQRGKPYDWRAIAAFAFNRNWRAADSWICSELQAAALEYAGLCPPLYLAANKITPVALALAVSALPGVRFD